MSVLIVGGDGQDGLILQSEFAKMNIDHFVISRDGVRHKKKLLAGPDHLNAEDLTELIKVHDIKKIFFLAAFSLPSETRIAVPYKLEIAKHSQVEILLIEILSAIIMANVSVKFFYFSSSLVFGEIKNNVNELTDFNPNSLYAEHKIRCEIILKERFASHNLVNHHIIYFFNHESRYRSKDFFSSKLCKSVITKDFDWAKSQLKNVKSEVFVDMGYAQQFMQLLIQLSDLKAGHEKYIFSTSFTYTISQFLQFVIDHERTLQPKIQTNGDIAYIVSNSRLLSELGISSDVFIHGHELMHKLTADWKNHGYKIE